MLTKKLETLRFHFRLWGLKEGMSFVINLMRCGKETIYCVDLKERRDYSVIMNPELDFRFIENPQRYDSISLDYAAVKGTTSAARDRERIVSGKESLAVMYRQGRFAGWGWVRKGPVRYGNCRVGPSDCVIHKCRTVREHRRQGVYITLLVSLQNTLADRGIRRAYIGAKSFNKVSLRGIEKTGFQFVEECNLGSFVSRSWHHITGKGPKVMQIGT